METHTQRTCKSQKAQNSQIYDVKKKDQRTRESQSTKSDYQVANKIRETLSSMTLWIGSLKICMDPSRDGQVNHFRNHPLSRYEWLMNKGSKWYESSVSEPLENRMFLMSPSLIRSLVRSHRSLVCLLLTACFARALRCAHSLLSSWDNGISLSIFPSLLWSVESTHLIHNKAMSSGVSKRARKRMSAAERASKASSASEWANGPVHYASIQ